MMRSSGARARTGVGRQSNTDQMRMAGIRFMGKVYLRRAGLARKNSTINLKNKDENYAAFKN
jgi:hypothetical protein